MHDIEPYYGWRDNYVASEDKQSPFFGREYDEFKFTQKIYNYFIHPQWDNFGSSTLYLKILYVDYQEGIAMMELIGEWNDCLHNDIMYLKREVIDHMSKNGINKYILFCENVLNFHASDDSYYEEWYEDVSDESGWIVFANVSEHVQNEMESVQIQFYANFGQNYNRLDWRRKKPQLILNQIELIQNTSIKQLRY